MAHLKKKRQIIEEKKSIDSVTQGNRRYPWTVFTCTTFWREKIHNRPPARRAPIPPKCVIDVRKTKRKMAESSISISALSVETGSQLGRGDGLPAVSLN